VTGLQGLLDGFVDAGEVPGAVALVARGDQVEVAAVGTLELGGTAPMGRDCIMRIASITKPITAAAAMILVDDRQIAVEDEIARWLPELANPSVVRTPSSPLDDVVPVKRAITVGDLLTFRAGWGYPSDFSLPAVAPLFDQLEQGAFPSSLTPEAWVMTLAGVPLLAQPGEAWLYNTCSDILAILVARVSGQPFDEFLSERLFEPLAMVDTGFWVPPERLDRLPPLYQPDPGGLTVVDSPEGRYSHPQVFHSGGGGLVSTVDDWYAFGRMLVSGGEVDGRRVLSPESVTAMTTNHLDELQRSAATLFLEGQGWGYGGSVDIARTDPWNEPGRYGWVGGTGTTAHVILSTGMVSVLFTQAMMTDPTPTAIMRDFWRYAAAA
jgi:CubicO group peptidase (beta-lactamase class C family)